MSALAAGNFSAWLAQVVLLSTAGALLPILFGIRHPRSRLLYAHVLIAGCFALPFFQSTQHSLVLLTGGAFEPAARAPQLQWSVLLCWTIAAGILVQLARLALGLWRISRYRRTALPLAAVPESIRSARRLTGADAMFRLSADVVSPAAAGHLDPVVLLPGSFLDLDEDAQRSVACHELLHVRRRDWLATVLEETAAAFLWFSPGVWMLLSQARLSREQIVDDEVVSLTSAPEPYVQALLSIAAGPRAASAVPAAWLFNERHLMERLRSMLANRRDSRLRVALSYLSAAVVLAAAAQACFLAFPLLGPAQVIAASPAPARPFEIRIEAPEQGMRIQAEAERTREKQMPAPSPEEEPELAPKATVDFFFFRTMPFGAEDGNFTAGVPLVMPSPAEHAMAFIQRVPAPGGLLGMLPAPGQIVDPAEIERLREALGPQRVLTLTQAEDGRVQRIEIRGARRPIDESDVVTFSPSFAASDAAPADGVH